MRITPRILAALVAIAIATPTMAQVTATPAPAPVAAGPKVGDPAPDFTLPSSTQAGVDPLPLRLSELRGQVVVIAFFPKSRTKG